MTSHHLIEQEILDPLDRDIWQLEWLLKDMLDSHGSEELASAMRNSQVETLLSILQSRLNGKH